jgi:beta-N-acetylhexosaminidase
LQRVGPKAKKPEAPSKRARWRDWRPRWDRSLLAGIIVVAVGAAVASVLIQRGSDSDSAASPVPDAPPSVQKLLAAMSSEQKADAVLAAGFADGRVAVKQAGRAQLGGLFVGPEAWPGGRAGRELLAQIDAAARAGGRVPPLLITRQEGGPYNALGDLPPSQRQIDVETAELADRNAFQTGQALRAAGFHLNLAPVADVATLDSPIADRSFGDDPSLVAVLAAAAVAGCERSGLACAASHFPGLGGASSDPATGPATVSLDATALEGRELGVFDVAFDRKLPAVVLSLATYAAYDSATPAALSEQVIEEVLRDQYGFEGLAITDDLSSGAITGGIGVAAAAVQALEAGADLILVGDPADAEQARAALRRAIAAGDIPDERVNEAVARVLKLKRRLALLPAPRGSQGPQSQQGPQKGS